MSKNISTQFKCKCGGPSTQLIFKKPSTVNGSFFQHKCPHCESVIFITAFIERFKKNLCTFHTKYEVISDKLRAIVEAPDRP